MRVLLINVPHPSIGSRIPDDHLPPLGLLAIGGPLIDDGHEVRLIDAEFGPMQTDEIVSEARRFAPDAVLFGHSGSTSGHPVIAEVARAIARAMPQALIICGGVFPTYHWREILDEEPYVTATVRGEGEETARQLMRALEFGHRLDGVAGIAFSEAGRSRVTKPAPVIRNLDAYRIGWELIDHARYSYWGGLRAVVVQFSRGCPHLCNYCGQRGFWTRWRHRDPVRFAKELARLKRESRGAADGLDARFARHVIAEIQGVRDLHPARLNPFDPRDRHVGFSALKKRDGSDLNRAFYLCLAHDRFGKPVPTLTDHALGGVDTL